MKKVIYEGTFTDFGVYNRLYDFARSERSGHTDTVELVVSSRDLRSHEDRQRSSIKT